MTPYEVSTVADAITAATVQGLHAFIASEAKAAASDTQLEAAACAAAGGPTGGGPMTNGLCARNCN